MTAPIVHLDDGTPGGQSPRHPAWFRDLYTVTELIGGNGPLPGPGTLRLGTLHLPPGLRYPPHHHPAPEVYLITGGDAEWTIDDDTHLVTVGHVIYHEPWAVHTMTAGPDGLDTIWFWWAPRGETSVLNVAANVTEPWPDPPPHPPSESNP